MTNEDVNLKSNRSKIIWAVVGLVVLLAGFGWFKNAGQEKLKPKRGDVIESIYGLGTVTADTILRIRAGLTMNLKKLNVREGQNVKVGDAILKFDENVMRSSIDGVVTSVAYREGELVSPQANVVTITNMESLYLEVSLEQQSILRVKAGQVAMVSFESLRDEKIEGKVTSVYPRDNQFIVRIEIAKWPAGVLPGMTADVAILVGKREGVLLIPIKSVVAGQVTRIRDSKKERVPIKLGIIDGLWGEVLSDNILETDEVISRK